MISVIIPAYKNTDELVRNLRHNLPYLKGCEVIVVNDFPTESIKSTVRGLAIKLVENKRNLGFGGAVNEGVVVAKGQYVMLLNSDVVLDNDSYRKALSQFEKQDNLFAVTFAQHEKNGSRVGKNRLFWDMGLVKHSNAKDFEAGITGWAEGGSCLIDRSKYLRLEGFDLLYAPFYWEDIDLSYRAWKAGYEVLFNPHIEVQHHHESTIGKFFDSKKIKRVSFRNHHIFMMKNMTELPRLFEYWFFLLPNFVYYLLHKQPGFIIGYFDAIMKFPQIQVRRARQKKYSILQDSKILSRFT